MEIYLLAWHAKRSPFDPNGALLPGAELHPTTWLSEGGTLRKQIIPRLGATKLVALTRAQTIAFRRQLVAAGLRAKTVSNVCGILRKALGDAVADGLIEENPMQPSQRRATKDTKHHPTPLSVAEVEAFLAALPTTPTHRRDGRFVNPHTIDDLYRAWFLLGWRSSELAGLRRAQVHVASQLIDLRTARSPRNGGLEAAPKTGRRTVDVRYSHALGSILARRIERPTAPSLYVFHDSHGKPISQEWLAKRVWAPTLKAAGITPRGQYSIRDTFITLALSAGEDPGWVAQVCGTSEAMIFAHYRRWMPGADLHHGRKVASILAATKKGSAKVDSPHPDVGWGQTGGRNAAEAEKWRRRESNPQPTKYHRPG